MKDWKLLLEASDLGIEEPRKEQLALALASLEAAFRPLAEALPVETEPAFTVAAPREEAP